MQITLLYNLSCVIKRSRKYMVRKIYQGSLGKPVVEEGLLSKTKSVLSQELKHLKIFVITKVKLVINAQGTKTNQATKGMPKLTLVNTSKQGLPKQPNQQHVIQVGPVRQSTDVHLHVHLYINRYECFNKFLSEDAVALRDIEIVGKKNIPPAPRHLQLTNPTLVSPCAVRCTYVQTCSRSSEGRILFDSTEDWNFP